MPDRFGSNESGYDIQRITRPRAEPGALDLLPLTVQEIDGSPVVDECHTIKITNGRLQKLADGIAQLNIPAADAQVYWTNVMDYGAAGDGVADDTDALNDAWSAVPAGGVLFIPPGEYLVSDTLSFTNKNNVTIQAENAIIKTKSGSNLANKAIVDIAGSDYMRVRGLRIESTLTSNKPDAGLVLGRVDAGDGAGQYLDAVWVSGTFAYAAVYDCGAELTTHLHCRYHTTDGVPCYYTSSTDDAGLVVQDSVSNVCKRFYSCTFLNYGSTAAHLVELHGVTKDISFRDCYWGFYPDACHAIHLSGSSASTYGLLVDNCRFEGADHANARLLYHAQDLPLTESTLRGLLWTVASDYVIEFTNSSTYGLTHSEIELSRTLSGSTKLIYANANLQYNRISGIRNAGAIVVNTGVTFATNYVVCYSSGNPISGGYQDAYTRQDNMIVRLYDYAAEIGLPSRRIEGAQIDSGATPSVAGMDWWLLNYSSPTTITDFADPVDGQVVHFVTSTANATISNNANIKLRSAANWTMPAGATLTLIFDNQNSTWYEVARMDPTAITTGSSSATFAQGSGNAVNDASTFDGYTLSQVVKALRTLGLLA